MDPDEHYDPVAHSDDFERCLQRGCGGVNPVGATSCGNCYQNPQETNS